uniref:Uncharacterized protein n=1 Tax=Magnetococcus massalia (strain MO-1) TaxID=451514 RepID=A0A1S7LM55_MAGMO|nr:Protein of unknown function. membrane protein of unknown function [Candidatus Magnetococcus massalia]
MDAILAQDAIPPLREDLKIRKLTSQGEIEYIIKEPESQSYYRFNEPQYLMMSLFDGRRDKESLIKTFDEESDEYEYDEESLDDLLNSCREYELLKRSKQEQNAALVEKLKAERKGRFLQAKGSLLNVRFHLHDPDELFDRAIVHLRWIWKPWFVKFSFLLIFAAVFMGLTNGSQFLSDFEQVFFYSEAGQWNFLLIWCVVLGAIAFHEIGHGLTCKNFGGNVDDMGFLLLAFQPCLYCNVNDAWMFENNRHKIYTALAGVWFELVVSALMVFVWLLVDVNNIVGRVAFILMTVSTASSLFLNLNPLMKFDGYYILSDLVQVPNLRQNSISYWSWTMKRLVFRIKDDAPLQPTRRERRIYLIYGTLVTVYMTLMLTTIALLLYGMVAEGMGTFFIILYIWFVLKIAKLMTGEWWKTLKETLMSLFFSSPLRKVMTITGLIGFITLSILWSPRVSIVTEGEVDAQALILHAPEAGFISYVGYGNDRKPIGLPGDPLFTITAPEMNLEVDQLRSQRESLTVQRNLAMSQHDTASLSRNVIQDRSLAEKISALSRRQGKLIVETPKGAWRVDGPPPQILKGRYMGPGEEVLRLISDQQRHVNVVLEQPDYSLVQVGQPAQIRLAGSPDRVYSGTVKLITPVAKVDGPNRLFQVRIEMEIPEGLIPPPLSLTCDVRILGENRPLWEHLLRPIRRSLRADLWV